MAELAQGNLVTTKRGMPIYRVNPSIPPSNGLATRHKRFQVPGGKAAVIVDNTSGEIKGIGGVGFWWQEEVDASQEPEAAERSLVRNRKHLTMKH